jgi:DOPA 4,5-dioxygenase
MTNATFSDDAPYHAHVYIDSGQELAGEALRDELARDPAVLFVGSVTKGKTGPHPIPQFEAHFLRQSLDTVIAKIRGSGLRALVHPLTDDDMADHTSLATLLGEPVKLDLTTLDPPGMNQGVPRFGKTDF